MGFLETDIYESIIMKGTKAIKFYNDSGNIQIVSDGTDMFFSDITVGATVTLSDLLAGGGGGFPNPADADLDMAGYNIFDVDDIDGGGTISYNRGAFANGVSISSGGLSILSGGAGIFGDSAISGDLTVTQDIDSNNITASLDIDAGRDVSATDDLIAGDDCIVADDCFIFGDLTVLGFKSAGIYLEEEDKTVILKADEAPITWFNDKGIGTSNIEIEIDPYLLRVTEGVPNIQVTPTSQPGLFWVEKKETSFIVYSDEDFTFDWVYFRTREFDRVRWN